MGLTWTRSRLLAAGGSGLLRFVLSAPAYFVSVPVLLALVGRTGYGLWVLITTMTGWLFLSDFGLRTYVVREASVAAARDEWETLDDLLGRVVTLYGVIVVTLGVAGTIALKPLVAFALRIPPSMAGPAVFVLGMGLCAFCVDLVGLGLFRGVSDGLGFVTSNNVLAIGYTWVRMAIILGTAWLTKDVRAMAVASLAASALGLVLWRWTAWRAAPRIRYSPRRLGVDGLREVLGFSGAVQLNDAITAATPQLVEALVVRQFGLSALGLFDVGVQLFIHIRSMSFVSWFPVMPWLAGRGERSSDSATSARLTRTATVIGASLAATASLVLPTVVAAWLPAASTAEVSAIVALVAAGAIIGVTAPAVYAWNAKRTPWRTTIVVSCFAGSWLLPTIALGSQSLNEVARLGVLAALGAVAACYTLLAAERRRIPEIPAVIGVALLVAAAWSASTMATDFGGGLGINVLLTFASIGALFVSAKALLNGDVDAT